MSSTLKSGGEPTALAAQLRREYADHRRYQLFLGTLNAHALQPLNSKAAFDAAFFRFMRAQRTVFGQISTISPFHPAFEAAFDGFLQGLAACDARGDEPCAPEPGAEVPRTRAA